MNMTIFYLILSLLTSSFLYGCPPVLSNKPTPGFIGHEELTSPNVQRTGSFREVILNGEIPSTSLLRNQDFFAEYDLDLAHGDCNTEELPCIVTRADLQTDPFSNDIEALLQIDFRFRDEEDFNEDQNRKPLNVVFTVDTSESTGGLSMQHIQRGLLSALETLGAEDLISIIGFSAESEVFANQVAGDEVQEIQHAIENLHSSGQINLYEGLFRALNLAKQNHTHERHTRIVLISTAHPSYEINSRERIKALVNQYPAEGCILSTIGIGEIFDFNLLADLAEIGQGGFYFPENSDDDIRRVLTEDLEISLTPLAKNLQIEIHPSAAYSFEQMTGMGNHYTSIAQQNMTFLSVLLKSHNESINQKHHRGRFFSVLSLSGIPRDNPLIFSPAQVRTQWWDIRTEEIVETPIAVEFPENYFPDESNFDLSRAGKAFVVYWIYSGFKFSLEAFEQDNPELALHYLHLIRERVSQWLGNNSIDEIRSDLALIDALIENVESAKTTLRYLEE